MEINKAIMTFKGEPIEGIKSWEMKGFTLPDDKEIFKPCDDVSAGSLTFTCNYDPSIKVGKTFPFKDESTGLSGNIECFEIKGGTGHAKVIKWK